MQRGREEGLGKEGGVNVPTLLIANVGVSRLGSVQRKFSIRFLVNLTTAVGS
jgi:hypothetical protein